MAHEQEMKALTEERKEGIEDSSKVKLPKPTLQKLTPTDNVERFLATFEKLLHSRDGRKECGQRK